MSKIKWPKMPTKPWPLTSFSDMANYYQRMARVLYSVNETSRDVLETCAKCFEKDGDKDAAAQVREYLQETAIPERVGKP